MRITLLSGFSGSGKTTLLRRLPQDAHDARLGMIVEQPERLDKEAGGVVAQGRGTEAVARVLDAWQGRQDLDDVVVEMSGDIDPWPMIEEISARPSLTLDTFATLIDAPAFIRDFAARESLFHKLADNEKLGVRTSENLMAEQIQCASVLLLSKLDMVRKEDMPTLIRCLGRLNPETKAYAVDHGKVSPGRLLKTGGFRLSEPTTRRMAGISPASKSSVPGNSPSPSSSTPAVGNIVGSASLKDARPFHPRRLWEQFQQPPVAEIQSTKGFVWMASRDDQVLMWSQAAGRPTSLQLMAYWKAPLVFDTHSRLLPGERKTLEQQMHDSHPVFGDRLNELTITGTEPGRKELIQAFQNCLCTPEEIRHWQMGDAFEDPWPKALDGR